MIDRTADWHTHSALTDGADDPEVMAKAAADRGLTLWGLSDHVRADSAWVPAYIERVRTLRAGDVEVKCGVEAKMLDLHGNLDLPADIAGLDYVLVADHRFPGRNGPIHPDQVLAAIRAGELQARTAVEQLLAATSAAVRRSAYPPIVAHLFSILPKCGLSEEDVPGRMILDFGSELAQAGARVEINEKWRCPSRRVVNLLAAAGVELTCGSDAHRHQDIGTSSYVDSLELTTGSGNL